MLESASNVTRDAGPAPAGAAVNGHRPERQTGRSPRLQESAAGRICGSLYSPQALDHLVRLRVEQQGIRRDLIVFRPTTDWSSRCGLCDEAVVGEIDSTGGRRARVPDWLRPNPAFLRLLHRTVAEFAHPLPAFADAARRQRAGYVRVVDERYRGPGTRVLPEDVMGRFEVADGRVVAGSYRPNPHYRLFNERGFFQLNADLRERLGRRLHAGARVRARRGDAAA